MSAQASSTITHTPMQVKKFYFTYGQRHSRVFDLTSDTTFVDIDQWVHEEFLDLPGRFYLVCYTGQAAFICIDQNSLQSIANDCTTANHLQLFVVRDSIPDLNSQSLESTTVVAGVGPSDSNTLNDSIAISFQQTGSVDNGTPSKDDESVDETIAVQKNIPTTSQLPNSHMTNIESDNMQNDLVAPDPNNGENINDIFLSSNTNPGNTIESTVSPNEHPRTAQPTDEHSNLPDRLKFSHDVLPSAKHHYLSDKYNVETGQPKNGNIPLLQGHKTEEQIANRESFLPEIEISQSLRNAGQLILLLYVVKEERKEDMWIWYLDHKKGFVLPEKLHADAILENPLEIHLADDQLPNGGIFRLETHLLTNVDKKRKIPTEILRLSNEEVPKTLLKKIPVVSSRTHIKPTRILCVPKVNNEVHWHLFTLSDFIHPSS